MRIQVSFKDLDGKQVKLSESFKKFFKDSDDVKHNFWSYIPEFICTYPDSKNLLHIEFFDEGDLRHRCFNIQRDEKLYEVHICKEPCKSWKLSHIYVFNNINDDNYSYELSGFNQGTPYELSID